MRLLETVERRSQKKTTTTPRRRSRSDYCAGKFGVGDDIRVSAEKNSGWIAVNTASGFPLANSMSASNF